MSRVFKGVVVPGAGWAGLMAVPVADLLFGAGQTVQEVLAISAGGLLAVAEPFETWLLDTHTLRGLDLRGLAGAIVFIVLVSLLSLPVDRTRPPVAYRPPFACRS